MSGTIRFPQRAVPICTAARSAWDDHARRRALPQPTRRKEAPAGPRHRQVAHLDSLLVPPGEGADALHLLLPSRYFIQQVL